MEIKSADFLVSSAKVADCPADDIPEYAFIGRSNVGKSSLINMLTNKRNLAMTSSTPGKTQLINHFKINDEWFLVDLPGYGYARLGKDARKSLKIMIESYILERKTLVHLFILIDSRLEAQQIDLDFIQWLGENAVSFSIIFTKIDKLNKSKLYANIEAYKRKLLKTWEELPPIFLTSSTSFRGKEELLAYINEINNNIKLEKRDEK